MSLKSSPKVDQFSRATLFKYSLFPKLDFLLKITFMRSMFTNLSVYIFIRVKEVGLGLHLENQSPVMGICILMLTLKNYCDTQNYKTTTKNLTNTWHIMPEF